VQNVETYWDFVVEWRWRISNDRNIMSIENNSETTWYKRSKEGSSWYE